MNTVEQLKVFKSTVSNSLVVSSELEESIKDGYTYTYQDVFTIGVAAKKYILWTPPPATYLTVAYPLAWSTSSGPCISAIYTGSDYSGGTPLTFTPRNGLFPVPSVSTLLEDPTGATLGLQGFKYLVGTDSQGSNSGGGQNTGVEPFISNPANTYLFEIENQSGSEIQFEIRFTIAEIAFA